MTLPTIFVLIVAGVIGNAPVTQVIDAYPTKSACETAVKELQKEELNDKVQAFGLGCIEVRPIVKAGVE